MTAIEAAGGIALAIPTHMGELDQLEALANKTLDHFGGIDILVNNAANALAMPFAEMTPEAWEKSMNVNLRGPVFLTQYCLPGLEKSGRGSIINVSSAGAFLYSQFSHIYAAAKAAMLSYVRSNAAEFAASNIRVNAIAPGTVDTDMVRNNSPEQQELMAQASLLRRAAHEFQARPFERTVRLHANAHVRARRRLHVARAEFRASLEAQVSGKGVAQLHALVPRHVARTGCDAEEEQRS